MACCQGGCSADCPMRNKTPSVHPNAFVTSVVSVSLMHRRYRMSIWRTVPRVALRGHLAREICRVAMGKSVRRMVVVVPNGCTSSLECTMAETYCDRSIMMCVSGCQVDNDCLNAKLECVAGSCRERGCRENYQCARLDRYVISRQTCARMQWVTIVRLAVIHRVKSRPVVTQAAIVCLSTGPG